MTARHTPASHTDALLDGGASRDAALTGGYQLAFRTGAVFVLGALVIAAAVLRTPRGSASGASADAPASSRAAEADSTSATS
ncbi:hypothetical protein [Streptomyces sp. SCL15-4]|uniref:hypothetical protein n=1 Tax=Streptomyces sp. SCL15-4 TaxID=2967221 RepID=UPI0029676BED|nr:hypothetical protein [Streptomyces sp. SCL15-4]